MDESVALSGLSTGMARPLLQSQQFHQSVEPTMSELLLVLLLWIDQHSAFEYRPEWGHPAVERLERRELVLSMFRDQVPAFLSEEDLDDLEQSVAAIYNHDTRTMLVATDIDLQSAYGQAVLVHELVHFIQFEAGDDEEVRCLHALEKDAYTVQRNFMEAKGLEPDFDAFTVAVRSMCPEELSMR
jgi:hypothetical protein